MYSARILLLIPIILSGACSSIPWISDSEPGDGPKSLQTPIKTYSMTSKDFNSLPPELKQAKIMSRLIEIEDELRRHRSRIAVLEKGLLLGIIPDELRNPMDLEFERKLKDQKKAEISRKNKTQKKPTTVKKKSNTPKINRGTYLASLTQAQAYLDARKYGKAIAAFEALQINFPKETKDGATHYWIGISWFNLKEDNLAKQSLNTLIKSNASSPWVARAKLTLAKIAIRNGLRQRGINSLQDLIKQHPDADAAAIARRQLVELEQAL
jgi:TolA-binding protein